STAGRGVPAPAAATRRTGHPAAKEIAKITALVLLGLVFFLGIVMIAMSVSATKPDPSKLASFKFPDNVPKELFSMDKSLSFWSPHLRNGLAVCDKSGMKVRIEYPSAIKSIHRHWYSPSAYLQINGVKVDGVPDSTAKDWADNIEVSRTSESDDAVSPGFSVTVPLPEKDLHKTLDIDAMMLVAYPSNNGNGSFSNVSQQLSKHYELFVVSAQEMALRERILNQKSQLETDKALWEQRTSTLVVGITFSSASLLFFAFAYVAHKRSQASKQQPPSNAHQTPAGPSANAA
ncbi:MAG: hypothetical protein WAO35_01195, partial [Terriglobia bacterium]